MAEIQCAICGKDATCLGRYDTMTADAYACDDCCGHGCEDGHCELLEDLPEHVTAISNALADCAEAYGSLRANLTEALDLGDGVTDDEELVAAARGSRERMDQLDAEQDKLRANLSAALGMEGGDEELVEKARQLANEVGDLRGFAHAAREAIETAAKALDAFRAKGGGG